MKLFQKNLKSLLALNNSIDYLKDIDKHSTRKLIYICKQLEIPMPMRPTRDFLIKSIKSYYSDKKIPKEKAPKNLLKKERKTHILQTPRVPINKKKRHEEDYPTPILNYTYSSSSSSSSRIQSRTPSPNPIYSSAVKNHSNNNNQSATTSDSCSPYYLILILILLIIFVFILFQI